MEAREPVADGGRLVPRHLAWVPFELQSALAGRVSYLYYMIIVMPGIYVGVSHVAALLWRRRRTWLRGLIALWSLTVMIAAVVMYPFVTRP